MASTVTWHMPPPWDISKMKPELKFCVRGQPEMTFNHDDKVEKLFQEPHIRSGKRFVFATHGFLRDAELKWMDSLRDAIFASEKLNSREHSVVVFVQWKGGAKFGDAQYPQAASNSQAVGVWLGQIVLEIRNLSEQLQQAKPQNSVGTPPTLNIIGIGYSLGAHLMGAAGRTSQTFDVIMGLDPAGPLFENMNADKRLRKEDAKFVQAIHTDGFYTGTNVGLNYYGTLEPLGHIDFYPNGGYEQPQIQPSPGASHARAVELFIWSILNPGKLVTNRKLCHSPEAKRKPELKTMEETRLIEMGYHATVNVNGCYYIRTNAQMPWNYMDDGATGSQDPKLAADD